MKARTGVSVAAICVLTVSASISQQQTAPRDQRSDDATLLIPWGITNKLNKVRVEVFRQPDRGSHPTDESLAFMKRTARCRVEMREGTFDAICSMNDMLGALQSSKKSDRHTGVMSWGFVFYDCSDNDKGNPVLEWFANSSLEEGFINGAPVNFDKKMGEWVRRHWAWRFPEFGLDPNGVVPLQRDDLSPKRQE